jgi:hypothetical protein
MTKRILKVGALLCFAALSTSNPACADGANVARTAASATFSAEHFDDFSTYLRDMLQDWIISKEVDKAVEQSKELVKNSIKADGDGYLIRIRVYQNSEGVKQLGDAGNVQLIGRAKSMDEAVRNFVRKPPAELAPMPGTMQRAPEDGFLIWTYQKDGNLVTERTDYPASEAVFEKAKVVVQKERDDAAKAAAARAEAERQAAAQAAALAEYSRRQTEELMEAQRRALAEQDAKRRAEQEAAQRQFQQQQAEAQRRAAEEQQRLAQQRAMADQQQRQMLQMQIQQEAARRSMGAPSSGGGGGYTPGMQPGISIPGRP